ncbi:MAG: replication-associated recombination protein A [Candidatus Sabulitectum sp.]|nr:replication-associated recombination protein A [Candidatus Sabulitectum sp.]
MEKTLFTDRRGVAAPFAELFRPRILDEIAGQEQLLGPEAAFRRSLETASLGSFILWGPPGSGKTTLALIVADHVEEHFVRFSAVTGGVKDVRRIVAEASLRRDTGQGTTLFVDEIHRFNRSQQDAFLPHVEDGTIRLVGATTENPSFHVNAPLLSRCSVYVLQPLQAVDLFEMVQRVVSSDEFHSRCTASVSSEAMEVMAGAADGDARRCLNMLEQLAGIAGDAVVSGEMAADLVQAAPLLYDNSGEEHYNLISALHKSMRSSDADASLYWLARMIASGEDPLYIGRRMIRFASEDIGLADPSALTVAMRAVDAYRFLGSPEGDLALAEAVVYMALAPKSNSVYAAWKKVLKTMKSLGSLPVPLHLRNAPTALMKKLDYGKDYQYAHERDGGIVTHNNFPRGMKEIEFYLPSHSGREVRISDDLERWKAARRKIRENERNQHDR